MRLIALPLLFSLVGSQHVQLHNCAKMILITGKFWPCIVWQRPNATTTTSTERASTSTSTEPSTSSTTEEPTTEETTTTTETTTTERTTTTTRIPSTKRSKTTTTKKIPTTTEEEEESTTEIPSTTTVVPSTTRIETTSEREEIPTTEEAETTTEIRAKRVKPLSSTPSSTTSTASTTTEEKTTEGTTTTTTSAPSTTTDVEIQVVTKQQKKGESSSTSESVEEEEENVGVVQSTTPPPYFVTLLTDRSREEFYRIAKNPFLTKAELLYRIRRWASKQPKLVREAIFDIEHELIRQQSSVRKEAASILEALPLAFLQYTNIRDNVALTKQEEQEDLDSLYKAMPRKTAKVLRYVLMMAGDSLDSARKEENKLRHFSVQAFRTTIRDTLG